MAQDLRNLFEEEPTEQHVKMSEGHEANFLKKLDKALPKGKPVRRFWMLNIAASVIVLLGLSYGAYQFFQTNGDPVEPTLVESTNLKTLGDVSPDLKKVEDYYLASINLELSKVQLTPENKELFDGYVQRLKELNVEYDKLTVELNDNGPNTETLDALIDNLKYRLNLVMRLKEKLQDFNDDTLAQGSI
jgi:hypothetical protein